MYFYFVIQKALSDIGIRMAFQNKKYTFSVDDGNTTVRYGNLEISFCC